MIRAVVFNVERKKKRKKKRERNLFKAGREQQRPGRECGTAADWPQLFQFWIRTCATLHLPSFFQHLSLSAVLTITISLFLLFALTPDAIPLPVY